jgi:hypothetical protein
VAETVVEESVVEGTVNAHADDVEEPMKKSP